MIEVKDCGTFKIANIKTNETPTSESLTLSNISKLNFVVSMCSPIITQNFVCFFAMLL
jgi:hypothetical protein